MSSPERIAFPPTADGLRVGLLGGSFNPPHDAHRALSLFALKRLQLDRVWWLVSPGNPLKDTRALPALSERLTAARGVADHPAIHVTGIEAVLKTRYTVDTIAALSRKFPAVHFVWLMGADNLAQFHRWRNWQRIAHQVPVAVIDRPSDSFRALASPAAQALSKYRHNESAAGRLAGAERACLDISARNEVAAVLDATQKSHNPAIMNWQIETINPTCVGWNRALTDSASEDEERKGP